MYKSKIDLNEISNSLTPTGLTSRQLVEMEELSQKRVAEFPIWLIAKALNHPKSEQDSYFKLRSWGFRIERYVGRYFYAVTPPSGWSKETSGYWTIITDALGVTRASQFYKGGFYDQRTFISDLGKPLTRTILLARVRENIWRFLREVGGIYLYPKPGASSILYSAGVDADPCYYACCAANKKYIDAEKLKKIYVALWQNYERNAADAFAQMMSQMDSLSPSEIIKAVYKLDWNNWEFPLVDENFIFIDALDWKESMYSNFLAAVASLEPLLDETDEIKADFLSKLDLIHK